MHSDHERRDATLTLHLSYVPDVGYVATGLNYSGFGGEKVLRTQHEANINRIRMGEIDASRVSKDWNKGKQAFRRHAYSLVEKFLNSWIDPRPVSTVILEESD